MLRVYINVGTHADSLITNEVQMPSLYQEVQTITVYTNVKANADSLCQVQMLTVDIKVGKDDDSFYQSGC